MCTLTQMNEMIQKYHLIKEFHLHLYTKTSSIDKEDKKLLISE